MGIFERRSLSLVSSCETRSRVANTRGTRNVCRQAIIPEDNMVSSLRDVKIIPTQGVRLDDMHVAIVLESGELSKNNLHLIGKENSIKMA